MAVDCENYGLCRLVCEAKSVMVERIWEDGVRRGEIQYAIRLPITFKTNLSRKGLLLFYVKNCCQLRCTGGSCELIGGI